MSSTDAADLAARIRRFFDERLMPAADAVRERKAGLFEMGPDPDAPSYYVERTQRKMTPEQFELGGLESPAALAITLGEFWKKRRMPELAELARELGSLAGDLREVEEETDEVSPFIYVMF